MPRTAWRRTGPCGLQCRRTRCAVLGPWPARRPGSFASWRLPGPSPAPTPPPVPGPPRPRARPARRAPAPGRAGSSPAGTGTSRPCRGSPLCRGSSAPPPRPRPRPPPGTLGPEMCPWSRRRHARPARGVPSSCSRHTPPAETRGRRLPAGRSAARTAQAPSPRVSCAGKSPSADERGPLAQLKARNSRRRRPGRPGCPRHRPRGAAATHTDVP
mmetsp:Transcript_65101/g.183249  ORF Transcript_65101/g.183249 Transcript_65101/m.183249 type:complete len:214 (+) Transcript_65101:248-889(+)